MRTAGTNTLTATWWSRLGSACMTITRHRAVPHVREWPTYSRFIWAAASTPQPDPSAPQLGQTQHTLCRHSAPGPVRGVNWIDLGLNGSLFWLPRMETEGGTFLLAHLERAVGGKTYIQIRKTGIHLLTDRTLVGWERSLTNWETSETHYGF